MHCPVCHSALELTLTLRVDDEMVELQPSRAEWAATEQAALLREARRHSDET